MTQNYNPATGSGDAPKTITLGANGNWKPADSLTYTGCGYNDVLRLRLRAKDPQNVEGFDFVVIHVDSIC